MKFSIGYNEKEGFLSLLQKNKENICSVYFALPSDIGKSGRPARQDFNYTKDIEKLVCECRKLSIRPILLLNATLDGPNAFTPAVIKNLILYIEKLISLGLESISITNLLYLKILKKRFPNLLFYCSVNARLKTVEQALYFKQLGIDILTLDRDINRDIPLIKRIQKRTGLELQLMLNEPCLRNCPFRHTHFEAVAHNSEQIFSGEFEDYTCYPMIQENKRLFFRIPFVRPEDLHQYDGLIDYYKLVTRDARNEKIQLMLDAYKTQKYDGNLLDLFDLEPGQYLAKLYVSNKKLSDLGFFEKIVHCPGDCEKCTACDQYL